MKKRFWTALENKYKAIFFKFKIEIKKCIISFLKILLIY